MSITIGDRAINSVSIVVDKTRVIDSKIEANNII